MAGRSGRDDQPRYLLLGEILRPHGIAGELRLRLLTDYPERIAELETIYIGRGVDDPNPRPFHVSGMRMHQGYGLLSLREVPDRSAAERLRDLFVMVAIEDAVPLEEGEFYLYELIGLEVQTTEGEVLGELIEVLETGANDVYIVHSERYGEVLIPAIEGTIISTDIEAGILVVNLPEGLLPR